MKYEVISNNSELLNLNLENNQLLIEALPKTGSSQITIQATTETGGVAAHTFKVYNNYVPPESIDPPQPPTLINAISDITLTPQVSSQTIDISQIFATPDGEQLKYEVISGNGELLNINLQNNQLSIEALPKTGSSQITIQATTETGGVAAHTFKVFNNYVPPESAATINSGLTELQNVIDANPDDLLASLDTPEAKTTLETLMTELESNFGNIVNAIQQPETLTKAGVSPEAVATLEQLLANREVGAALGLPTSVESALKNNDFRIWDKYLVNATEAASILLPDAPQTNVAFLDFAGGHGENVTEVFESVNPNAEYERLSINNGNWAEQLVRVVEQLQAKGERGGLVNLSLDLTAIDSEGRVTTRYELTPEEQEAIQFARENNVLLVVAAGNTGGQMSGLGMAAEKFDNIITVGAVDRSRDRADYSAYDSEGVTPQLSLVMAPGGEWENDPNAFVGTSRAAGYVTAAASLVWGANSELNYQQVKELLLTTANDLADPGWDAETGVGLLDVKEAVERAKVTEAKPLEVTAAPEVFSFTGEGRVNTSSRAASAGTEAAIEELRNDRQNLVKDLESLQDAGNPDLGLDELRAQVEEKTEAAFEEFRRLSSDVAIASAKENMVLEELGFASQGNGIEQGRLQNFEAVKLALEHRLEALKEAKVELEKPSANERNLEKAIGEVEAGISSVERRLRYHKIPTYQDYYWWVATSTSQIKEEDIDIISDHISFYQTKYDKSDNPWQPGRQKRPILLKLKEKAEEVKSRLQEYLNLTAEQTRISKHRNGIEKDRQLYNILKRRAVAKAQIDTAYSNLLGLAKEWRGKNQNILDHFHGGGIPKKPNEKINFYKKRINDYWKNINFLNDHAFNVGKRVSALDTKRTWESRRDSYRTQLEALKDKKKIADIVKQQKIEALELQIAQTQSELDQLEKLSVYTEQEVKAADDRLTTIEQQLNTLLNDKASAEQKLHGYKRDYRRFQEAGEEKNSISQQIQELEAQQRSIQQREQNERLQLQNLEAAKFADEPAIVQTKNNINSLQQRLRSHRIPTYPSSYRTESTTAVWNDIQQIKADVSFYRQKYNTPVRDSNGKLIRNRQIFLDLIPRAEKVQESLEKYLGILNKQNRIQNGTWGIEEDRELSQVLKERDPPNLSAAQARREPLAAKA
ncbi:MAG: S8 family serine peptidase, partial [Okeania sp. SIO3B3]|nr:S8 family serine peptidase [Okeania sp. SIO3B3]